MNKANPHKVIFSSIFFLFFLFSILALLSSQFSEIFSQLFLILTRNKRGYDNIVNLIILVSIAMLCLYFVFCIWKRQGNTPRKILAIGICIVLISIFIFKIKDEKTIDLTLELTLVNITEDYLSFFELLEKNIISILISGFFYIFFLILPLGVLALNYYPDPNHKLGRYLQSFRPEINTSIIALFASSFQPYYDKSNVFLYFDFALFCLCLGLFIYVFLTHKELFGFYEYANIIFLIIGIWVCLLCSNILAQAIGYYNARTAFYALVFLGWCGEWIYRDLYPSTNKTQSTKIAKVS